jgi:signal transduction histidine kinase
VSGFAILTLGSGLVALCQALLNLQIYALRRSEREHLWLAVAALGIAASSLPLAGVYGSSSAAEAIALRRWSTVGSFVYALGFVRFSAHALRLDLRWTERLALATLIFVGFGSLVPGLVYTGRAHERAALGESYVDAEMTLLGAASLLGILAVVLRLFVAYRRHMVRGDRSLGAVSGAAMFWMACTLADLGSSTGLLALPPLPPVGYLGFVLAFTFLLLRRFVLAMGETEARAALLERLVEQRTQALREKELQLAHGERLAAAGTLAAGLAHEINNPIAFVLANLNHLQALRKEPGSEAEIEEVLLETQEGVARLRGIVEELLRLAKRGARHAEPVDLGRVVDSVLPMVRHEAKGRVLIEPRIAPAPLVTGDPGWLGQVVLNLLQNSIHALLATGRDGRVRVAVEPVAGGVQLLVEDDGPGIPPHVLPRIFEPFFTTKGSGQGTGLGLAVTREIVSRHGGTIDVETFATGTRFRVTLPAAPDPTRTLAPATKAPRPGGRSTPSS